ncbi:NUDIX hydrolase [Frankia sp. Mgl5]|uniref:NUDIX domain-containing protein n=1 Tax=Frankia sp. Mgl5 TaxID=2933793 RepID=UPI0034D4413E|nr:NUDIX hydrolase [Frankia sp. Mgl5]
MFSRGLERTLLVRHPRFGWLSPGGRLEEGETPREGALREVTEETGINADLLVREPAAVLGDDQHACGRIYGLAYALTANPAEPLRPEPGQPATWFHLKDLPPSYYPLDHPTLLAFARDLRC